MFSMICSDGHECSFEEAACESLNFYPPLTSIQDAQLIIDPSQPLLL